MDDQQEHRRKVARVIANAWMDPEYLARLKSDPQGVLKEAGVAATHNVKVVEDSEDTTHLIIPKKPAHLEEHRAKQKAEPGICSDNPQICSDHPDLCSTFPRPDICSFA